MVVTFDLTKEEVFKEVAQTSSYTGAKMLGDDAAYDRIFTTDEDAAQLERFWNESCATYCAELKRYLISDSVIRTGGTVSGHRFEMEFSAAFDAALVSSMRQDLFSFFVMNITAKWYVFTNKDEAADYATAAASALESFHRKACYKRKPTRPRW